MQVTKFNLVSLVSDLQIMLFNVIHSNFYFECNKERGSIDQLYIELRWPFIQLNKYKTDSYFLYVFQSNTSVCLIISVFCKSCEPICKPEIVLKQIAADFQANPTDISCKNMDLFCIYLAVSVLNSSSNLCNIFCFQSELQVFGGSLKTTPQQIDVQSRATFPQPHRGWTPN